MKSYTRTVPDDRLIIITVYSLLTSYRTEQWIEFELGDMRSSGAKRTTSIIN